MTIDALLALLLVSQRPMEAGPSHRRALERATEAPRYGGFGTPPVEGDEGWHLPVESAIVMRPEREGETDG